MQKKVNTEKAKRVEAVLEKHQRPPVAAQPAPRLEITSDPMKDQVHRSSLSPGHRVRYTNNYHTETAGNETIIYVEPKGHPKPKVSIKLVPSNPIYSASKSLKDAFDAWEP